MCDTPRRNPELILIVLASHFELLRVRGALLSTQNPLCYCLAAQQPPSKAFLTVQPIHLERVTADSRVATIINHIARKFPNPS